ncbi:nucleoside hydrolase [Klebsiella quasipneumoniae]|uniref:nucleoside hydrolase n=1 Tax=Klebsiella quasipneumoniae TaxID=1463165 RepID=UPI001E50CA72|nr:nucleoside hydrolase [Klebsiella quasipneumoniae]MCD7091550.1 nucleoside hydrolase [Klebsiella quasipneumoniae subsp. quasipneumoniae]
MMKIKYLICLVVALATCVFGVEARTLPFEVVERKEVRVIISSDAKNEADDDFAVAHALLTPTFIIKGLIAAHYANTAPLAQRDAAGSMEESYQELQRLTRVMGKTDVPLYRGATAALNKNGANTDPGEGAQAIIREALRKDDKPLFVLVLGPMTDVAAALRAEPRIAEKMTVIWIGGLPYPKGGWEYNLFNDPLAADEVFASSTPLWQVPHNVYMSVRVSLAELAAHVRPQGEVGEYLWQQMIDFNHVISAVVKNIPWPKSEVWVLGDNPSVALLLDDQEYNYTLREAPRINDDLTYAPRPGARQIRVYDAIDVRFTLEDFYAKLALVYGGRAAP